MFEYMQDAVKSLLRKDARLKGNIKHVREKRKL